MKVAIVPNGVNVDTFKPINRKKAENWFEQNFFELDDDVRVLYAGRFSYEKGLVYLLESLKYMNNCKIYLAGDGPEKTILKRIAKKYERRVFFLGRINRDYMPLLYNAMDVFVLPSLSEGFPNSLLEALACGLPVVATPVGVVSDIIRSQLGVIVEKKNSKAIALGINKVINSNLIEKYKIHKIIRMLFSFDIIANKIYGLYSSILDRPPSHVCFASLYAPPYDLAGVGVQVFELSKALCKLFNIKTTIP